MSVMVVGRFKTDPARMEAALRDRAADFAAVGEYAKTHGALHHHFAAGNGEVMFMDEWETAEAFQTFFSSQPKIPELMQAAGVTGPPEIQVYDTMKAPGDF